jgi:hypothetical protein
MKQAAYLIDRWPDERLPFLEVELRALCRNGVAHVPFIFRPPRASDLSPKTNDLVTGFQYLPDAMVIEAEWQSSAPLVRELEAMRANQKNRPPSDLFLEQARAALVLRRLFLQHNVTHVHATSSRTLLSALILKKLLGLSISAAIEDKPVLSEQVIIDAFDQCAGGRSNQRKLLARRGDGFMFDQMLEKLSVNHIGRWLIQKAKIGWTGDGPFWQEWSRWLIGWTRRA